MQRAGRGLCPQATAGGVGIDPTAIDGNQRELDRDEEPCGDDQQEYGSEADGRVDGYRPENGVPQAI